VTAIPMFPLGTVAFPHMVLPLHVFEPRYRVLMQRVLAGDGTFGIVLIERGHEVGGGDQRTDVGTLVRVVEAEELDDGRWLAITVGVRRFAVRRWLEDDPHPWADVDLIDDPIARPSDGALRDDVATVLRRVLALQSEMGDDGVPVGTELVDDPLTASYQAAVLAPLGPMDAQAILAADSVGARLELLLDALTAAEERLQFRLREG
jgi:uncharacterized protein